MSTMREQLDGVLSDFKRIPCLAQAEQWHLVQEVFCDAPHEQPKPLRRGQKAAYLFFLGQQWLRIGQTAHSSRFVSQHYLPRGANSRLTKDIWTSRSEFGFQGEECDVGHWIKQNCGRANVILPASWPRSVLLLLESYLHYRLAPRFEGPRGQSTRP